MKFPTSFERAAMSIPSRSISDELAATFRGEADTLLKLSQVEAHLEDSFYRALDELQRLQRIRKDREEKAIARKAKAKTA